MSDETTPSVEIAPNPILDRDEDLARAFEEAVVGALSEGREDGLLVRFGVWEGEQDGPRFLCKVEARGRTALGAPPAWRWWSPLVRTPLELAGYVRDALRDHAEHVSRSRPTRPQPAPEFWGWAPAGQGGA
jgi:hypothetical protein